MGSRTRSRPDGPWPVGFKWPKSQSCSCGCAWQGPGEFGGAALQLRAKDFSMTKLARLRRIRPEDFGDRLCGFSPTAVTPVAVYPHRFRSVRGAFHLNNGI